MMNTFQVSLEASYLHDHAAAAHAYSNIGRPALAWEKHDLERALDRIARIEALTPALRERLAAVKAAMAEPEATTEPEAAE
jgi:hypothetical protein